MTGALRKLLLGRYARRAATPRIVPYPGWTTGSDTDADNPEMHVRRGMWESLRKASTILWLDGLKVRLFPGNETSRVLFLTGLYEPNEFCWLERYLKPGMTVIDGGANMGLYALYAARRVGPTGTVVAVEPSVREYDRLVAHVRLNRLRNVRCRRLALARTAGKGRLRIAAEWNAGHNTLGEFGYQATELVRVEEVKVRALDAIVADEGLDRVDLIKLDIEGAEYDALLGAEATIRRFRPAILVELADRTLRHQGAHSGQIWDFLEGRGYTLYGFDANHARLQPAARKPEYDSENLVAVAERGPHPNETRFRRTARIKRSRRASNRFVVVTGTGHSGTKWLAETLHRPDQGVLFFHQLKLDLLDKSWDALLQHELEYGVDGLFAPYFDFVSAEADNFRVIGDSMSWSFHSIPLVHQAFGIDRVIILVRNGIQTVHSMYYHNTGLSRDHWLYEEYLYHYWHMLGCPGGAWERYTEWECWCFNWSLNLTMMPYLQEAVGSDRCMVMRFDDLISDVAKLRQAIKTLAPGLEMTDERLRAAQESDVNRKILGARSPAALWRGWSGEQRAVFERICGPGMAHYGYDVPPKP